MHTMRTVFYDSNGRLKASFSASDFDSVPEVIISEIP